MPALSTIPSPGEQHPDTNASRQSPQDHPILRNVLAALGRPPDLFRVVLRPLWGNHYRVNVFRGEDITSACIAHSYFVEAGAAGEILSATPRITRLYT
jgi:hypothetical protein